MRCGENSHATHHLLRRKILQFYCWHSHTRDTNGRYRTTTTPEHSDRRRALTFGLGGACFRKVSRLPQQVLVERRQDRQSVCRRFLECKSRYRKRWSYLRSDSAPRQTAFFLSHSATTLDFFRCFLFFFFSMRGMLLHTRDDALSSPPRPRRPHSPR